VLTNLHASRARLALALGAAPDEMLRAYLKAMEKPLAPRVVPTGPVKEVVLRGGQVNLLDLPQIIHHEGDAGVFLTAAISFAKDPTADVWNCAYNRLMLKGRDTTSVHLTLGKHLWEFHRIAESRNAPLPVAFAIGVHPAIALGALAIGSVDEDERGIMGALLGEPLELVRCETSDVLAPAHAELIIEAEILPHQRTAEGPFGEFTGYSLGERQREIVKVKAITHRRDAMFQDIAVAHLDHLLLSTIPIEAPAYADYAGLRRPDRARRYQRNPRISHRRGARPQPRKACRARPRAGARGAAAGRRRSAGSRGRAGGTRSARRRAHSS
jgi:2,5-furandicarboxylate decarboxylase 1